MLAEFLLNYGYGYFKMLPWWEYVVITLVFTQITVLSITIYLHRHQAHRAIELHPLIGHFCRLWLWLTTGMSTKAWVGIHRKHHAKVETADDPHSPVIYGIGKVLREGAELYRQAPKIDPELMDRYGNGTPNDWIERHVYIPHGVLGLGITLLTNLFLFGVPGLIIWALQMMWTPLFAAGGINGIGHYWGYRNFETRDNSRNITPIAFFLGGEELHNNHHTYANAAKFSVHWWEFDMGWLFIRLFQLFGLAKPNYVAPKPLYVREKNTIDADTIRALMRNRFQVLAAYTKKVIIPVLQEEKRKAGENSKALLSRARNLLVRHGFITDPHAKESLESTLAQFASLNTAYQLREQLQNLWQQTTASQKELIDHLHNWCQQAEATGIQALKDFSKHIKTYVAQPA